MNRAGLQLRLTLFATLLALCVITMGAYVRLSDAGLGCPDWPGCYGQLDVPSSQSEIKQANSAFPQRPVETSKAWKEMIHRYLAGVLGLSILILAAMAWSGRKKDEQPLLLPWSLLGLVIFQGLLGMWTVTLLVKPLIVTAHLIGGLATLSLLWLLTLQLASPYREKKINGTNTLSEVPAIVGLAILLLQIMLGGWTSSNYAAMGCIEFPTCYSGLWWPPMDFKEAFVLWRGQGINYEYGVLDGTARTAIHMTHRLGALLTALYLSGLCLYLLHHSPSNLIRRQTFVLATLLVIQIILGISNVLAQLPLFVAVLHNAVAALLLLSLVTLIWTLGIHRDISS